LRAGRVDFETVLSAKFPGKNSEDEPALVARACALLRACMHLNPDERATASQLLDEFADLFEIVSPGAAEHRAASRDFTLGDDEPWYELGTVDEEFAPLRSRAIRFARELSEQAEDRENESGELERMSYLSKPNILVHAVRAVERMYIWLSWAKSCGA